MDQLVVLVLQLDVVLVVSQVLRLQRVDPLVVAQIVELELVLDADLLLASFFFLVVGGAW